MAKILETYPPIWDDIIKAGMKPKNCVFAYGAIIYNPFKIYIPEFLIKHEEIHEKQQGDNPRIWWQRYLEDDKFRLEQEVEAYAAQYNFIVKDIKDRNRKFKILWEISRMLANPIYGEMTGQNEACLILKKKINK